MFAVTSWFRATAPETVRDASVTLQGGDADAPIGHHRRNGDATHDSQRAATALQTLKPAPALRCRHIAVRRLRRVAIHGELLSIRQDRSDEIQHYHRFCEWQLTTQLRIYVQSV
jgi:hypothetical protein